MEARGINTRTVLLSGFLAQIRQQQSAAQSSQISSQQNSAMAVSQQGQGTSSSTPQQPAPAVSHQNPEYSYKVKIINPNKKSDTILRQMNSFSSVFTSPLDLRLKIINECGEHVPNTVDFNVGYYDGKQAKVLIANAEDLQTMYKKYCKGGSLTMWCDGRQVGTQSKTAAGRKRKLCTAPLDSDSSVLHVPTSREEKECEVESIFERLSEEHGGIYETPLLRLWARMMVAGIHDDYDNPPNTPAFVGSSVPKRSYRRSNVNVTEALSGAAVAFVDAMQERKGKENQAPSGSSPSEVVDLRMKNYQQLRYVQQLYEDGILSAAQLVEQKELILSSVRNDGQVKK